MRLGAAAAGTAALGGLGWLSLRCRTLPLQVLRPRP
jgi:hypothetical protein